MNFCGSKVSRAPTTCRLCHGSVSLGFLRNSQLKIGTHCIDTYHRYLHSVSVCDVIFVRLSKNMVSTKSNKNVNKNNNDMWHLFVCACLIDRTLAVAKHRSFSASTSVCFKTKANLACTNKSQSLLFL